MKKLLLTAVIACLLCGCSQAPCTSPDGHKWGKWKNVWNKVSEFGSMRQSRECQTCGHIEIETH